MQNVPIEVSEAIYAYRRASTFQEGSTSLDAERKIRYALSVLDEELKNIRMYQKQLLAHLEELEQERLLREAASKHNNHPKRHSAKGAKALSVAAQLQSLSKAELLEVYEALTNGGPKK